MSATPAHQDSGRLAMHAADPGAVAVYCGFRSGRRPEYAATAVLLGRTLASRGQTLVYGGGRYGMMGTVADAALAAGGRVIGVIPVALVEREEAHPALPLAAPDGASRLEVVADMHERKARMLELVDACVVLPGGLGTLDEMFEVLTWRQLGVHDKPCGIINVEGYFDALLAFIDEAVADGFIDPVHRALLQVAATPEAVLDGLRARPGAARTDGPQRDEVTGPREP